MPDAPCKTGQPPSSALSRFGSAAEGWLEANREEKGAKAANA
jgi:hypothetical protein